METNRAYLAKVGTRCQSLQCLFSQHQAGLLLTPWCHLCWLLFQPRCWQAAEGASGDVVKVLQLWGRLGSPVPIPLLYLNIIFAWNSVNCSNITRVSLSVRGDGRENHFVFCRSRCFSVFNYCLEFEGRLGSSLMGCKSISGHMAGTADVLWEPVAFCLDCVQMWHGVTSVSEEGRRWMKCEFCSFTVGFPLKYKSPWRGLESN